MNARLIFILVCVCLIAAYLQAAVGFASGGHSWFDGR
jgi:hypothetical protein